MPPLLPKPEGVTKPEPNTKPPALMLPDVASRNPADVVTLLGSTVFDNSKQAMKGVGTLRDMGGKVAPDAFGAFSDLVETDDAPIGVGAFDAISGNAAPATDLLLYTDEVPLLPENRVGAFDDIGGNSADVVTFLGSTVFDESEPALKGVGALRDMGKKTAAFGASSGFVETDNTPNGVGAFDAIGVNAPTATELLLSADEVLLLPEK